MDASREFQLGYIWTSKSIFMNYISCWSAFKSNFFKTSQNTSNNSNHYLMNVRPTNNKQHFRLLSNTETYIIANSNESLNTKLAISEKEIINSITSVSSPSSLNTANHIASKNSCLTFHELSYDCHLKIFSYLSDKEKAMAERVCINWRNFIRTPCLWKSANFTQFKIKEQVIRNCNKDSQLKKNCRSNTQNINSSTNISYESYKSCVRQYVDYLLEIQPNLEELLFSFDIGDIHDGWLKLIKEFLSSICIKNLKKASLNWKETSAVNQNNPEVSSSTWSTSNYSDHMHRNRRRQRQFCQFFDFFTANCSQLIKLNLPFDWSPISIKCLSRLTELEELTLEDYFVPQPLMPDIIQSILSSLPKLKKFTISVVVCSGLGILKFDLSSKSLQTLDLSRCSGLSIGNVDLPELLELLLNKKSFHGLLMLMLDVYKSQINIEVPCLYQILAKKTPKLKIFNGYQLKQTWKSEVDIQLYDNLYSACCCKIHCNNITDKEIQII